MTKAGNQLPKNLLKWYDSNRRDLPWRVPPNAKAPDPYLVLVSEFMLQQTQVATVIPYFHRFIERLPTIASLASADEQEVLRLWQGLGYYSRARNLQAAARAIVALHRGAVPDSVDALLKLPGIGRYTAGAIASIAFDLAAPILDGNVIRVLTRLDKITTDPRQPATLKKLWQRAAEIVPKKRAGDFNSALMELGATICTPRSPKCLLCPVRDFCKAFEAGLQEKIPAPRKAKKTPLHRRWVICIRNKDRWLIEQRPATGRWAALWQFTTIDADAKKPTEESISEKLGLALRNLQLIGTIHHALTHRRYIFEVFSATKKTNKSPSISYPRAWVKLQNLDRYPLPKPHLKIAQMLRDQDNQI